MILLFSTHTYATTDQCTPILSKDLWETELYSLYKKNDKDFELLILNCANDIQYIQLLLNTTSQSLNGLYKKSASEKTSLYAFNKEVLKTMAENGNSDFQHLFARLHYSNYTWIEELEARDYYTYLYWEKLAASNGNPDAIYDLLKLRQNFKVAEPNTFLPYFDINPNQALSLFNKIDLAQTVSPNKILEGDLNRLKKDIERELDLDQKSVIAEHNRIDPLKEKFEDTIWLKGYIGSSKVTFILTSQKHHYEGYYFYDSAYKKWGSKFNIKGNIQNNKLSLNAIDKTGEIQETIELNIITEFNNHPYYLQGIWKRNKDTQNITLGKIELFDNDYNCDEMRLAPQHIFSLPTDFGSGTGDTVTNLQNCNDTIENLAITHKAYQLAKEIHSPPPRIAGCGGTITSMYGRVSRYYFAMASYAPDIFIKILRKNIEIAKENLKTWPTQQHYNKQLYKKFNDELEKLRPQLANHFKSNSSLSPADINLHTEAAIDALLFFAGGYGNIDSNQNKIVTTYDSSGTDGIVNNSWNEFEMINAINYVLLNEYPDDIFQYLLSHIENINQGFESPLFYSLNDMNRFNQLIKKGALVDYQNGYGKTVLYYAIQDNNLELVKHLISLGANVNHHYKNPADYTAEGGNEFDYACIQRKGRTPLMHAAQHASIDIIKFLIAQGADINAKDTLGNDIFDYLNPKDTQKVQYLTQQLKH